MKVFTEQVSTKVILKRTSTTFPLPFPVSVSLALNFFEGVKSLPVVLIVKPPSPFRLPVFVRLEMKVYVIGLLALVVKEPPLQVAQF